MQAPLLYVFKTALINVPSTVSAICGIAFYVTACHLGGKGKRAAYMASKGIGASVPE